jgi:hypothetical protein
MRLLRTNADNSLSLTWFNGNHLPRYAILSHTWGDEEVTFNDIRAGEGRDKAGFRKIRFYAEQARKMDLNTVGLIAVASIRAAARSSQNP